MKSVQIKTKLAQWLLAVLSLIVVSLGASAGQFAENKIHRLPDAVYNVTTVQMKGTLSCIFVTTDEGEACALSFRDSSTGKSYKLSGIEPVMDLYSQGARKVAISGEMLGYNSVKISRVVTN